VKEKMLIDKVSYTNPIKNINPGVKFILSMTTLVFLLYTGSKTVFIFEDFSKASAFFIKIHFCADFPIQTIIAVGVASHKAQGQAITKTVTNA